MTREGTEHGAAMVGITWDHRRGVAPIEGATVAFRRRHPDVDLRWEARSLASFEDTSVSELARRYDLMAVDHPFIGTAVADGALTALDEHLPLQRPTDGAVGPSQQSYRWSGRHWAVAVDAAAQVAAYRPDVFADILGGAAPTTWAQFDEFARALPPGHRIGLAANPVHLYGTLLSLCHDQADEPRRHPDGSARWWDHRGPDPGVLAAGFDALRRLLAVVDERSLALDPIGLLAEMTDPARADARIVAAPLVFGYVQYARRPAPEPGTGLIFVDPPSRTGTAAGTLLGGVGLAVSAHTRWPRQAEQFVAMVTDPEYQRTRYVADHGQPAQRSAWTDPGVDAAANGFYSGTLATLEASFVRPRVPGYPRFQRTAADELHRLLARRASTAVVVARMRELWRATVESTAGPAT